MSLQYHYNHRIIGFMLALYLEHFKDKLLNIILLKCFDQDVITWIVLMLFWHK